MAYAMVAQKAGGSSVFKKETIDLPKPKKGEVLIRQTAIGVNFIDVYHRSGVYPPPGGEFPAILGSEGAGVVQGIGAGVTGVRPGDRVAYTVPGGAYASHRVIDAEKLVKIPSGIKDEIAAAAMLKGLTAHYLIHDSYKAKAGDTVLFHAAAGGVGLIAGQWLKSKGVNAIGTAGGKEKCALARKHGFAKCIDYTRQDFVDEVRKLTKAAGVQAVYDSVGKSTYPGSLKCLANFGTFVSFGQSSGTIDDFKLADLSANGSLYAQRPTLFTYIAERKEFDRRAKALFKAIKDGEIKIHVNQTFTLDRVKDAHDAMEKRQTTGQTVLIVE
ncbi:MAG: quinone oxidoreductase [Nitratireductor sp.]|nr:quinone oxidoreductase [Nitratireductor sp.]